MPSRGVWGHAPPENFEIQMLCDRLQCVFSSQSTWKTENRIRTRHLRHQSFPSTQRVTNVVSVASISDNLDKTLFYPTTKKAKISTKKLLLTCGFTCHFKTKLKSFKGTGKIGRWKDKSRRR